MKKFTPDYPAIALPDLSRLRPDPDSASRFERQFWPGIIGGLAIIFILPPLVDWLNFIDEISRGVFRVIMAVAIMAGLAVCARVYHRMLRTRPRSLQTGNEMKPFVLQDPQTPKRYELAYVDEASGTYFRMIYFD